MLLLSSSSWNLCSIITVLITALLLSLSTTDATFDEKIVSVSEEPPKKKSSLRRQQKKNKSIPKLNNKKFNGPAIIDATTLLLQFNNIDDDTTTSSSHHRRDKEQRKPDRFLENNNNKSNTTTTLKENTKNNRRPPRIRIEKEKVSSGNIEPRIIGGDNAEKDDHPYFVEMAVGCGASLIHNNVILTAAHCLSTSRWDSNVWIGSHSRRDGIQRRINGVAIHPGYNYFNDNNDIRYDLALFTLNDDNEQDDDIVPLNRQENHPSTRDDTLTVIGVGSMQYYDSNSQAANGATTATTNGGAVFASILQELQVPYIPHDECAEIYAQPIANITIDERSMLCAGGEKNEDSCMGDSGGPILDESGFQVGVVSFGASCGTEGWPGVYSRVSSAVDWMDEFVCLNDDNGGEAPLNNNCGERFRVQIEVDLDAFPYEVSWYLKIRNDDDDSTTRSILLVPRDASLQEGIYTRTVNIPAGKYEFQIEDVEGDGICCNFGGDGYRIRRVGGGAASTATNNNNNNNNMLERTGSFGYVDTLWFDITTSGELLSGFTPYVGNRHQIRLDIMYDNYPHENSWTVINRDTSEMIEVSKAGSITRPGLVSTTFELDDGNYWIFVVDSVGDGICCFFGRGFVEINQIMKGHQDVLLDSHRGNFESLAQFEITLP